MPFSRKVLWIVDVDTEDIVLSAPRLEACRVDAGGVAFGDNAFVNPAPTGCGLVGSLPQHDARPA
jgi:hypothetical protein